MQTQYCRNVPALTISCAGIPGADFITNPKHQLKGVWTDATPVPSDIVNLGLAENLVGLSSLNLEEITMSGVHSPIEFMGDTVELNQLLRQISSCIGKMEQLPRRVAILPRSCMPHEELRIIAEPAGSSTKTSFG